MTTNTWMGSTSTNWFTASNWSASSVPASGDDVVIPTAVNAPILNAGTTVNSVTISGTTTLSLSTTLTVTNGVTLSSTGGVFGSGTVKATLTATGAATVTASGGQLVLSGSIDDNGHQLTLTIKGNSDILAVDGSTNTAETVSFNAASGTLRVNNAATLTVGTATAIGTGKLDVEGGDFVNASGVTFSTGTITGTGTVDADVTATGAAHISTAKFGSTLEIGGPINDNGNALTLTIADDFGILQLDEASSAHAVSFSGASGLLQLMDSSLTVGTQLAVGSGQVFLGGAGLAALTDASGVTINTGMIGGAGTLAAAVTATGAGTIYGNGLTLEITGAITDSGGALTLSTDLGTVLLDATSAADAVSFSQHGTVALRGALTVGTAMAVNGGVVELNTGAANLSDVAGISLGGGSIKGLGAVTGAISGAGTVLATGGLLELVTPIAASNATDYEIANAATNFLAANGTVGAGNLFAFLGDNGGLLLANDSGFDSTVSGFNVGVGGAETNFVDIEGHTVTITDVSGQGGTTGSITLSDGAVLLLSDISSTSWNAHTASDGNTGTDIFLSDAPCFLRGTMILTECGEVPVEQLVVGDRVQTLSGAIRPIQWIGVGRALSVRGRRNAATPVIVRKGAIAENVPHRDLRVTKGHALFIDGALIPIEELINHRTIQWDDRAQDVAVYHVELATHDVLIADGAPMESYRDDGNRWLFHNANTGWDQQPRQPYAPVLSGGRVVDVVWQRLLQRCGSRPGFLTTDEADVHLVADGRRIDASWRREAVYRYRLLTRPRALRIVSRAVVPMEIGTARDPRCLGVAVRRIELAQGRRRRLIEADHSVLTDGFHAFEPDNGFRWTNGDAVLPDVLFSDITGPSELSLHVGMTTRYIDDGRESCAA